jgi:hypothetical protein
MAMQTKTIDPVLSEVYQAFDVPLDRFFGDEALTERFVGRVRERLPACRLSTGELMARLLNLRKRGNLPRLRRAYFGRGATIATD